VIAKLLVDFTLVVLGTLKHLVSLEGPKRSKGCVARRVKAG
jgi:hypothetical protein